MSFLILIVGFFFLIKGADIFVEGAASIAKKFNVPSMIIGLTIVAMGTSAPEAAVSITSSLAGQNDMSVANVVGSNFFNILMVLGVSSLIAKLPVEKNTIKKDAPFLIIVSAILLLFGVDLKISRIEGIILLSLFTYFLINTIKSAKASSKNSSIDEIATTAIEDEVVSEIPMLKTLLLCIIGIIGIVIGGDMVVNSATSIATSFGMSANLVGLTIVAVGTSLPEFVTSIVAIKKGETEIAIGNVIGSNLFNILLVLGLATTIYPITISMFALIDIAFMVAITVLLYLFMKKDSSLVKKHGLILVIIYVAYMIYTILR
ncbi:MULTISPECIES: calcium/sodium antiporter [unclassified Romboutsia]|uniref:calcium/sodium antiporter n=1 Tax=unclassified Romboutsia TaxID=2626894 RepID=UPI0008217AB1|nr:MULTISPECIES: calcium/sodium antiporter [unclassified Romboutsia]SCH89022.1 Inner membrane protein yrbG [uncultured Clostridium sp.]